MSRARENAPKIVEVIGEGAAEEAVET